MRQWPFEGREAELVAVVQAFAGSGVNAVVVLARPGLGKTRLAHEALARLGCRTEWITATRAASGIPFGALAHLLPDDIAPAAGPVGLVRAVRARVASWGGRRRAAFVVDDAHLLDDASSVVIANLMTTAAAFVVLTVQIGEPLADCLARLGKEGETAVLELDALPDTVIDRLIDHSTDGVDAVRRHGLHTAARGNPLALRELLHGAVPGGLTDLVASRLDGLEPGTRHVVEMVACGEPVPLGFLERLTEAVAAAEESGLVVCDRDAARVQARLDHPMFGEVLRARMPVARSRKAYRDLAGELMATPMRRREDTLRAAVWQVESGRIVRPELVREGARQAIGRAGLVLAERLARAARDAEAGPEADWLLAEILEFQGRSDEAAELLPATPPAGLGERVRWAVARADWLHWARGDLAAAMRTWDVVAGHPTIEGARAFNLFFAGRCAEAMRASQKVFDREDSDPQGLVWATAAAAASLGFLGQLDEAQAVHVRGRDLAAAHTATLPWAEFQVEVGACLAHLASGYPDAAAVTAATGFHTAVQSGVPMMVSGWALYGGMAALARGRLADADHLLAEALAGFERNDSFRLRRCCLAAQAGVHALRGQDKAAHGLMARADRLDNGTNQVFGPWIETWRAWTAHAGGDTATAVEHARHAADLAAAADMPCVEAMARYDAVRLGGAADLTRMAALPGPVPAALAVAAHALTTAAADALIGAAAVLDGFGHHLQAAELATVAARVLRRTGHPHRAGLATATAATLRARYPGARTPMLAHNDLTDLLTARERQIAFLAVRHTSKQIATRLGIAVRTVDNTLARVYIKIGITSRAQLRTLLKTAESQAGTDSQS